MTDKKLHIVKNQKEPSSNIISSKEAKRQEVEAKFNRMWLTDPEQFNPLRNSMEKERLNRTLALIQESIPLSGKIVADLGCGSGDFSRILRDHGAHLDAVDISSNALEIVKKKGIRNIKTIQDYIPTTKLQDDYYDVVVSTDLIAWLPQQEHRLYMSELSRLVKPNGYVVCSSGLDIDTDNPLETFANLAETEFHKLQWIFSYHAFYIRIKDFFEAPERFAQASRDPEYHKKELDKRSSFYRWWFQLNSSWFLGSVWSILQYVTHPIVYLMRSQPFILLGLEKLCRLVKSDSGISHAIFIAQRRPLFEPTKEELQAVERKHKKQLWE